MPADSLVLQEMSPEGTWVIQDTPFHPEFLPVCRVPSPGPSPSGESCTHE